MGTPSSVRIVEVGLRDGLQNESKVVDATVRAEMIRRLKAAGLTTIEAGSFVSPKWVPQMTGTDKVLELTADLAGVDLPVLVPNQKGLEKAIIAGARVISLFVPATDGFAKANLNATSKDALEQQIEVARRALSLGLSVRGSISVAVHCPFEGAVDPIIVADIAERLMEIGCYEIALCDTTGKALTQEATIMAETASSRVGVSVLAVHFHDTMGRALSNTAACLELGITSVDSSVGGLGGCPYSPGAAGNLSTNKLVKWLDSEGIQTGVDIAQLDAIASDLNAVLR